MHTSNSGSARRVRAGLAGLLLLAGVAALVSGCLDRPVVPSKPTTKNLFVDTVRQDSVDKIDLLFMIDNSISMADKQAILAKAVPQLVDRLISPIQVCSNDKGDSIPVPAGGCAGTQYPNGPKQEFKPINDIHIGIVTSSLGGHGLPDNFCNPQQKNAQPNPTNNDHGHLLPKVRQGLTSYQNLGFLNFDGTNGSDTEANFKKQVPLAGELGCGFESSLEAWYRFLADPAPPANVKVENNISSPDGIDQEVLDERKQFLRPDSLLAIIMLTDEDDCSISDHGLGWLVARAGRMPRATAACATNPNDKCCRSCGLKENAPPSGCTPISSDPACAKGDLTDKEDSWNLRCFQQKRRFGLDLLYPTQRYVNALSKLQFCPNNQDLSCGKNDNPQANPIFKNGRDPSLVFLAAITGVPWQDIATDGSDNKPDTLHSQNTLEYKTAAELTKENVWDTILGDVNQHIAAKDPLMQESVDPRSGSNPITNDPIAPPSAGLNANPINGHEYDIPSRDDLQYACIFKLETPKTTGQDCAANNPDSASRPLCQNPTDGTYGTTQYYAKAYPGLRQLQVLKDFGENSIVASICPKVTTGDGTDPAFGYNPAVNAIIERLKTALGVQCLPRQLTPDETTKQVPCKVVEALPDSAPNKYDCSKKAGRAPLAGGDGTKLEAAVRARLKADGKCGAADQPACDEFSMCEIQQISDPASLKSCLNDDPVNPGVNGYCYIDENQGSTAFISQCPETERRVLRFVPESDTPTKGADVFIACAGATY